MSVTTLLSLNQDMFAKNLYMRTGNGSIPDATRHQAWLKAIEQCQMQEWLRLGLTTRGRHAETVDKDTFDRHEPSTTNFQNDLKKTDNHELNGIRTELRFNTNVSPRASTNVVNEVDVEVGGHKVSESKNGFVKAIGGRGAGGLLNQVVPVLSMAAFSTDNLVSPFGIVPPFFCKVVARPLMVDVVKIEQVSQVMKLALEEMTGIETKFVFVDSLNQLAELAKQTGKPLSKLVVALSAKQTDLISPGKDTAEEESISSKVKDKSESQPEKCQAIRFHAEWSEEGLRLWLGIDNNANIDKTILTKRIHDWVTKQNAQLLTLTWNGEQLTKNVQMQKDTIKKTASSLFDGKSSKNVNVTSIGDAQYFLNSYLQVQLQTKEMQ